MRILLTGATGFVGVSFLQRLAPYNDITCIGRTKPSRDDITYIEVDLKDNAAVVAASRKIEGHFDALVHLAAYVPRRAEDDSMRTASDVNVIGMVNLLEVFGDRVEKIVVGSTAEVYDQSSIKDKVNEDVSVGAATYYGVTKLASEQIAVTYGRKQDIPVSILRFSVMYGPNDPISRALPNFIRQAKSGLPIVVSSPDTLRDYIHISDVVSSIELAVRSDGCGVMNIGTGKGTSIVDAARHIARLVNSASTISVKDGDAVDIVIDTTTAEKNIGFKASVLFPEKLNEMVESFQ